MSSKHDKAVLASIISPLAITGISTSSTISLICFQSASPEYLCLNVLPWTHTLSTPSSSSLRVISKAVLGPEPVPSRIFTVIGTFVALIQALTISITWSGDLSNAAPALFLHTLGAGQPKFISIISALCSSNSTVVTISLISPPNICGINGFSRGSDSTLSHELASCLDSPDAAVNSVMDKSAPHSLANNRYARSVTPAMGARNNGTGCSCILNSSNTFFIRMTDELSINSELFES